MFVLVGMFCYALLVIFYLLWSRLLYHIFELWYKCWVVLLGVAMRCVALRCVALRCVCWCCGVLGRVALCCVLLLFVGWLVCASMYVSLYVFVGSVCECACMCMCVC